MADRDNLGHEDYSAFTVAVLRTACTLVIAHGVASLLLATWRGAAIAPRLAYGVLPYIELQAAPATLGLIGTWATAGTVAVLCLRLIWSLLFGASSRRNIARQTPDRRRLERQTLDGQATGLAMAAVLLVYQSAHHFFGTAGLDRWVTAYAVAGILATTVLYRGFRPEPDHPHAHLSGPRAPSTRKRVPA